MFRNNNYLIILILFVLSGCFDDSEQNSSSNSGNLSKNQTDLKLFPINVDAKYYYDNSIDATEFNISSGRYALEHPSKSIEFFTIKDDALILNSIYADNISFGSGDRYSGEFLFVDPIKLFANNSVKYDVLTNGNGFIKVIELNEVINFNYTAQIKFDNEYELETKFGKVKAAYLSWDIDMVGEYQSQTISVKNSQELWLVEGLGVIQRKELGQLVKLSYFEGVSISENAFIYEDYDNDGVPDHLDNDIDGDGVSNTVDAFPYDVFESTDLDNDGIGDNSDSDIDGDGVRNTIDLFPENPKEFEDYDLDGIGNNQDNDNDNDGVVNELDAFEFNKNEWSDLDGDGIGDNSDNDIDGDGVKNSIDFDPFDPTKFSDTDNDGIEDSEDADKDNDGVDNADDAFPLNKNEWSDLDMDGIGDNSDNDIDGDGVENSIDFDPLDPTKLGDFDNDGIEDSVDTDSDNDGVDNADDAFPLNKNEWSDLDMDGIGDNSDNDIDGDGVENSIDFDPLDPTKLGDFDNDGIEDSVDTDSDNDGVDDADDAFPLNKNEWSDLDMDGIGDNSDSDIDGDGVANSIDFDPLDPTKLGDVDQDGIEDSVDTDNDNDGVDDVDDAFPLNKNEWSDLDGDGIGDNNDTDIDGDNVLNINDAFPLDNTESLDFDLDGIGNNLDDDDDNDGVLDVYDDLPFNTDESIDTDGDGIGNNADIDDDGDLIADTLDAFPLNKFESKDTDLDGIGNNEDTDDDNDGVPDTLDFAPLDSAEHTDSDNDGVGDNADLNDDNDWVDDAFDPAPFDDSIPGKIEKVAPGSIVVGMQNTFKVVGKNFTTNDQFYVDGNLVVSNLINDTVVELIYSPIVEADLAVEIRYQNLVVPSDVILPAINQRYFPYSEIPLGGMQYQGYFDPVSLSLYSYSTNVGTVNKLSYLEKNWTPYNNYLTELSAVALSPDYKSLVGVAADKIELLDINGLNSTRTIDLNIGGSVYASDIEIDLFDNAVLATDYRGSGSTSIYSVSFDFNSNNFGTAIAKTRLYNSAIARSGDGSFIQLGESGLSPVQSLTKYDVVNDSIYDVSAAKHSYSKASISQNGDYFLINNIYMYNSSYSALGTLNSSGTLSATVLDNFGRFAIAIDTANVIRLYEFTDYSADEFVAIKQVQLNANAGRINSLVLSQDGLTLFALGESRVVVIPVWQIQEDKVGSLDVCPSGGCILGVEAPNIPMPDVLVKTVEFNTEVSDVNFITPNIVNSGDAVKIIVESNSEITFQSVLTINDMIIQDSKVLNQKALEFTVPELPAGEYDITIDGKMTDAVKLTVTSTKQLINGVLPIASSSAVLFHHPTRNKLYMLDPTSSGLTTIDLSDNSYNTQTIPSARDMSWCQQSDQLVFATYNSIESYNLDTQSLDKTIYEKVIRSLECVYNDDIIYAYNDQWEIVYMYKMSDFTNTAISSNLYAPSIKDVSRRGDVVHVKNSYDAYNYSLLSKSATSSYSGTSFAGINWSYDGSRGLNSSTLIDASGALLMSFTPAVSTSLSAISPDGNKVVFASSTQLKVYDIVKNGFNYEFSNERIIPVDPTVGTIRNIIFSHDGESIFASGVNALEIFSLNTPTQ